MELRKAWIKSIRFLFLFSVVLTVCGVILWGHNASSVPVDPPRESYIEFNKKNIQKVKGSGRALDLEMEIREDLNLCNSMYTEYNATSHHYEILKKRLHIMQEYIPANYSSNFRNPCWYDFYQTYTNPQIPTSRLCTYSLLAWLKHVQAEQVLKSSGESHLHCLPAFFLSAFPKCATSTLHAMITQHPLVATNRCKENWFWNRFINEKGREHVKQIHPLWYFSRLSQPIQYIESNPLSIMLDASPVYTLSFTDNFCILPTLLKRVLPEAKFILIMRNPSKRFFSHYWYQQNGLAKSKGMEAQFIQYVHTTKGMEDFHNHTVDTMLQFQSCIDGRNSVLYCVINRRRHTIGDFLCWGLYYYHIVPWLKIIPRERFLFLRTEDLTDDPSLTMSKVWHFLHLDDFPTDVQFTNVNQVTKDIAIPQQTKELLDEFYRPYNQLLADLLSDARYLWND